MPRYLNILMGSGAEKPPEPHPGPEELALLAQGRLEPARRGRVVEHVLDCERCYEVVERTLAELELDQARAPKRKSLVLGRPRLALAASVLVGLIGVGVYYNLPEDRRGPAPEPMVQEMGTVDKARKQAPAPAVRMEEKADGGADAEAEQEYALQGSASAPGAAALKAPAGSKTAPPQVTVESVPGKAKKAQGPALERKPGQGSVHGLTRTRPPTGPPPAPPAAVTLRLGLEGGLLELLRENRKRVWIDPDRLNRLLALIREKVEVEAPESVSWAKEVPEQLFGDDPPDSIIITIDQGRIVLNPAEE